MTDTTAKLLPREISSYDLIKSFAVVFMIVDHIGYYFFPENPWWRSVGRIEVPVWFFLIGYASGRFIPVKMWVGAVALVLANCVVGLYIFPMNVLVTMVAIRLLIDPLMTAILKDRRRIWPVSAILVCLALPTYVLFEYGFLGLIIAISGYLVRRREKIADEKLVINYMIFASVVFVIIQQLTFGFSPNQFLFMAVGTSLVCMCLFHFSSQTYPRLTQASPGILTAALQFMGRHTLEIYIAHLMLFKFAALLMGDERFGWFDVDIISH